MRTAAADHVAAGADPRVMVVMLIVVALLLFAASPLWSWERPTRRG